MSRDASTSCVATHDVANIPALFALSALCALGLLERVDGLLVTKVFFGYIALDFLWIALWPRAVPGGARLVLIHHAVTSVLLAHVLRRPERAMETCRNGLVEANTLLLILRRRSPRGSRANAFWNLMYLTTLVPVRFVWQPMLFVRLVALTSNDKALERFEVLGAQAFLLGFNVWLVARRRNSSANANTTKKGEKIS
jgi:hypothetical protein